MADLENSSNIYADLAQSSYIGRPNPLPYESLLKKERDKLDNNEPVPFNFSEAKNAHGYDIVNTGS